MGECEVRRWLVAALVLYVGVVVVLVLNPSSATPDSAVSTVLAWFDSRGSGTGSALVSFLLNVALFVPLSLIGAPLLDRWSLPGWVVAGGVVSAALELGQLVLLPTRDASAADVVANTLGVAIGIGLALALRRRSRAGERRGSGSMLA